MRENKVIVSSCLWIYIWGVLRGGYLSSRLFVTATPCLRSPKLQTQVSSLQCIMITKATRTGKGMTCTYWNTNWSQSACNNTHKLTNRLINLLDRLAAVELAVAEGDFLVDGVGTFDGALVEICFVCCSSLSERTYDGPRPPILITLRVQYERQNQFNSIQCQSGPGQSL